MSSSGTLKKVIRGLPKEGQLLGPLLGLVFLIYPVQAVLTSDPTPVRVSLALGGAALFTGVFLWLMWMHEPLWSGTSEDSEILKRRSTIIFLAVLALTLNLVLGHEWRVLFFHVNIAAGVMLLTRDAYVAIAGLAVLTLALGATSGMAWLVFPTVALGLWAISFVRQVATVAELRAAREELARLAVSEERLRFARDLHDLLGHSLSLITLKSELAGRLLPDTPENEAAGNEVRDLQGVARGALREVREAVSGYRKPSLDEELAGACAMLEAAGISCRTHNEVSVLPKEAERTLTWVVREGVTNVVRHSNSKNCEIRLTQQDGHIHAEVRDDGRGPHTKRNGDESGGSGLSGLAERVEASGGHFEAGPLPEVGFRLHVRLPIEVTSREDNEQRPPATGVRLVGEDGGS